MPYPYVSCYFNSLWLVTHSSTICRAPLTLHNQWHMQVLASDSDWWNRSKPHRFSIAYKASVTVRQTNDVERRVPNSCRDDEGGTLTDLCFSRGVPPQKTYSAEVTPCWREQHQLVDDMPSQVSHANECSCINSDAALTRWCGLEMNRPKALWGALKLVVSRNSGGGRRGVGGGCRTAVRCNNQFSRQRCSWTACGILWYGRNSTFIKLLSRWDRKWMYSPQNPRGWLGRLLAGRTGFQL